MADFDVNHSYSIEFYCYGQVSAESLPLFSLHDDARYYYCNGFSHQDCQTFHPALDGITYEIRRNILQSSQTNTYFRDIKILTSKVPCKSY